MNKSLLVCYDLSGEASSGKHVTNMETVRNLQWATYTCTLSFNTFGRSRVTVHFDRWSPQTDHWPPVSACLRCLAGRCRRHRHKRRVQVKRRIPVGLCRWLRQSALVLLPLLSTKGQSVHRLLEEEKKETQFSRNLLWRRFNIYIKYNKSL